MVLHPAIIPGLLVCALGPVAAQTTCEFLKVTGGASPGSYSETAVQSAEGRSVYAQAGPGGEIVAVLLFAQGSVAGRRLANEQGSWSPLSAGENGYDRRRQPAVGDSLKGDSDRHRHQNGGAEGGPGSRAAAAAEAGEPPRPPRSLANCAGGFWINLSGDGGVLDEANTSSASSASGAGGASASSPSLDGVLYPVFGVPDCADHPADITTDWFSVECATCELEVASPPVVIECDDEGDGAAPSPAPTITHDTPAPTITYDTPAPTITYGTPAPSSDDATPDQVATPVPPTASTTATIPPSPWITSPSPAGSDLLSPEGLETLAPSDGGGGASATPTAGGSSGDDGGGDDEVTAGGSTPSPEGGGVEDGNAEVEGDVVSGAARVVVPAGGVVAAAAAAAAASAVAPSSLLSSSSLFLVGGFLDSAGNVAGR